MKPTRPGQVRWPLLVMIPIVTLGCRTAPDEQVRQMAKEACDRQAQQNQVIARQTEDAAKLTTEVLNAEAQGRTEWLKLQQQFFAAEGQARDNLQHIHEQGVQRDAEGRRELAELQRQVEVSLAARSQAVDRRRDELEQQRRQIAAERQRAPVVAEAVRFAAGLIVGALMGSLVGSTEANIRRALRIIDAMAPGVTMIDEVEKALSGVASSGQTDSGVSARLFGTLLSWLSDHQSDVFTICTCNDIGKLPPESSIIGADTRRILITGYTTGYPKQPPWRLSMGPTIHYRFKSSVRSAKKARELVAHLRDRALDLPFAQVEEIVELTGRACDFDRCDRENPHRWLLIQAGQGVDRPAPGGGTYSYHLAPTHLIAFETLPGDSAKICSVRFSIAATVCWIWSPR